MASAMSITTLTAPEALVRYAKELPGNLFYAYEGGSITVREFQRASHRAARILPTDIPTGSVVGILAVHDLVVYETMIMGIQTAGLVPFPISPRLPPAAISHLLRITDAKRLLLSKATLPGVEQQLMAELQSLAPDFDLVIDSMPSISDLYPSLEKKANDDGKLDWFEPVSQLLSNTAIIIHSSGTTGLPKPIRQSYTFTIHFACSDVFREIEDVVDGAVTTAAGYIPPFHTVGNFLLYLAPIYRHWTVNVYPPSDSPPPAPNPISVLNDLKVANSNMMITAPFLLQFWAGQAAAVEYLKQLKVVYFGGGPLPTDVGDALAKAGVRLRNWYGGTELSACTRVFPQHASPMEWNWLEFVEEVDTRWVEQGEGSGLYELVFLHNNKFPLAKENLPNGERGYATNDVFIKHPTKENLWRVVGRKDDLLAHSNGERTMPGPLEDIIKVHPLLKDVMVFGHLRSRPGLLVDPKPEHAIDASDQRQLKMFRDAIWPNVERANATVPAHGQIKKELILVTSLDKPLTYTAKNAIIRGPALAQYQDQIDRLYNLLETSIQNVTLGKQSDQKATKLENGLNGNHLPAQSVA